MDPVENLLHFSTGCFLLLAGLAPGRLAGVAALAVGVLYTIVGVVGIVMPDLFGLAPGGLSLADDVIHLSLGALGLVAADLPRNPGPATVGGMPTEGPRAAPRRHACSGGPSWRCSRAGLGSACSTSASA